MATPLLPAFKPKNFNYETCSQYRLDRLILISQGYARIHGQSKDLISEIADIVCHFMDDIFGKYFEITVTEQEPTFKRSSNQIRHIEDFNCNRFNLQKCHHCLKLTCLEFEFSHRNQYLPAATIASKTIRKEFCNNINVYKCKQCKYFNAFSVKTFVIYYYISGFSPGSYRMDYNEKYHWITPFRYDINPDKDYGVGKCDECHRNNGKIVKYYNGSFVNSSCFGDRNEKIVYCNHCSLFTVSGDEDAKDKWK